MVSYRGRGDGAATLVEYALIVGLVVVASLGAIGSLQDSSSDELRERETAAGAGGELSGAGYSYGGGGGSTGGDPADPPPEVATPTAVTTPATKTGTKNTDASWNAAVTVEVFAGAAPLQGAQVEVIFTVGTTSEMSICPGTTNKKGETTCEYPNISESTNTITMVVNRVFGSNITEFSPPDPKPTTLFTCPTNVCKK